MGWVTSTNSGSVRLSAQMKCGETMDFISSISISYDSGLLNTLEVSIRYSGIKRRP